MDIGERLKLARAKVDRLRSELETAEAEVAAIRRDLTEQVRRENERSPAVGDIERCRGEQCSRCVR